MNNLRMAWLVINAEYGAYWPPVLDALHRLFPNLVFYTGCVWPKYDPEAPGTEVIEIVGKIKFVPLKKNEGGYSQGYTLASPSVVSRLLNFKPDVVFVSGFSMWTLLSIMFKGIGGWRLVLVYESSSPNVDFRDSKFRCTIRRWMTKFADRLISNSRGGRNYLIEVLGVPEDKVTAQPYMVPDPQALLQKLSGGDSISNENWQKPVFLCVGQVIYRKGIKNLLEACRLLKERGYANYTVIIVGDGLQRQELEALAQTYGLTEQIKWTGWVEYGRLGSYFKKADVFLFPTLEDTWGMVLLEAMSFGKPVLCSKWAGAQEMVSEGENGWIFDPYDIESMTKAMQYFIDHPEAIEPMGKKSQELIAAHTPETAAQFIGDTALAALNQV